MLSFSISTTHPSAFREEPSYLRAELGGKSPYDMFEFLYGNDILGKLNIRRIDPREVVLKPELLLKQ